MKMFRLTSDEPMNFGKALLYSTQMLFIAAVVSVVFGSVAAMFCWIFRPEAPLPTQTDRGFFVQHGLLTRFLLFALCAAIEEIVRCFCVWIFCRHSKNVSMVWIFIAIMNAIWAIPLHDASAILYVPIFFMGVMLSIVFFRTSNQGQRFWQGLFCATLVHCGMNFVASMF